jgi:hypothetical protein
VNLLLVSDDWSLFWIIPPIATLEGDKVLIESWRGEYNMPHSMLGYLLPPSHRGGIVIGNDNAGGV